MFGNGDDAMSHKTHSHRLTDKAFSNSNYKSSQVSIQKITEAGLKTPLLYLSQ